MRKLTEIESQKLNDGSFYTDRLTNSIADFTRMLECDDITIAQQKELRIAKKAMETCLTKMLGQTHL